MAEQKLGVVLFQLGGPDSLEAVEPFLYNLFCDPDIINFPGAFLARKPLAKFISSRRHKKAAAHYREIGGKSPIKDLTLEQASALERELNKTVSSKVFVAMRYWNPLTEATIAEMKKESFARIVLLPLYPHFSKATTVSSLKEWNLQTRSHEYTSIPMQSICCFFNHPLYIKALVENINSAYKKFSSVNQHAVDIVFSAHGVPLSLIKAGDPYQHQIEETVRLVSGAGGWTSPHHLCYQSRVGPGEWLTPSLHTKLRELAAQGRKHLLVVPISFVTDHEINIEAREEAHELGITQFEMMPALNAGATFISCLTDLVINKAMNPALGLPTCRSLFQKDPGRVAPTMCPYWTSEGR